MCPHVCVQALVNDYAVSVLSTAQRWVRDDARVALFVKLLDETYPTDCVQAFLEAWRLLQARFAPALLRPSTIAESFQRKQRYSGHCHLRLVMAR
jgi:hypothetical protein